MKQIHDYTGWEPYLYCPRCGSFNILMLTNTGKAEQYICAQCKLTFYLVEAAIWAQDSDNYIYDVKWRRLCAN